MAVILVFAMTSLLLGAGAAPGTVPVGDKNLRALSDTADVEAYFAGIDLDKMVGKPDPKTGERVAKWTADSKVNPETLGSYFQGDILIPENLQRNGLSSAASRWPGAVVPYEIVGPFSSNEKNQIQVAIQNFKELTCVRFVPRTSQRDYISLVNSNTGCWATLGRAGGKQVVNLQSPGCLYYSGTVGHELNHAVGFMHEQCRADRDDWVTINYANIQQSQAYNFNKWTNPTLDPFGISYDYNSLMHYGKADFSINGLDTITPKKPLTTGSLGQRTGLSWGDVFKINRMYNCTGYRTI